MAGDVTWVSGKKGYVRLRILDSDDVFGWHAVTDWSFAMHADFVKRNVMRLDAVQGYQDGVSGFKSGKITFKGPWAPEASPLVAGHFYEMLLGVTDDGPVEYGGTVHLTDLTPSDAAEDGPMTDFSGDTVGAFDFATVGTEGGLPT